MALSIIQSASALQPAQSPVMYSVTMGDMSYTSSQFQFTCKLEYWSGSVSVSSSGTSYQINKYPNKVGSGIFDLSKILNSALRQNLIQNTSSMVYVKPTFNYQFNNGAGWVSGSNVVGSTTAVVDGYAIWPETINSDINTKGLYPFLTDGPATQSVFATDRGTITVDATNTQYGIQFAGSNGSNATFNVTGSTNTANRLKRVPIGLDEPNFPISKTNLNFFTITSGSKSIRFDVKCESKYTPIRVAWKNRFGQLDFFTFNKVSIQSFSTTQRTYQPNAGNWDGATFTTDNYVNQTQRYIVDNQQTLSVNTDFLLESYNDIFKQLLVSDEIYWYNNGDVIPMSIATSTMQFKTGRVDKLIQYQLEFSIGRNYKQII
jgi:hypothetical protein